MNISFYTLGCKVNQYESESIAELFVKNGYTVVPSSAPCDVFIINSCTVTAESDRKTRQMLRRFRRLHPGAVLVLTGCMPQAFPKETELLSEADIVVGNTNPEELPYLVDEFLRNGERIVKIEKHQKKERFNTPSINDFSEHTRAFMKIEDGCERYCTYCIIPFARGRVRSKALEDITKEAESLAKSGYSEVVLVGINLSSFGKDIGADLCDAVEAVSRIDGIKRVRLGSLEPDLMSDQMLKGLSENPKFCPQFHLALQSGSDATLKRMNRKYDKAFFADLVRRIRNMFDNPSITTDIMVGFAGETDEEFKESLEFVKEIGFAKAHIFAYSRREGTFAYNMPNQVSKAEKELRSREMIAATLESEKTFLETQCGRKEKVLFETVKDNIYTGYTKNYTLVKAESETDLCGKTVDVAITENKETYCVGQVI